jgi:hypothetical protein
MAGKLGDLGFIMIRDRLFGAQTASHVIAATDFETADWLTLAEMTGAPTTSKGIVSFWYKNGASSGDIQTFFGTQNGGFTIQRGSDNKLFFEVLSTSTSFTFNMTTSSTYTSNAWRHVLISWDTNFSAGNKLGSIYVNGSLQTVATTDSVAAFSTNFDADSTWKRWNVANNNAGTEPIKSCFCEPYVNLGQWLDFSVEANLRKFYKSTGKPADLGLTGSVPTLTQPQIYLPNGYATINTNAGSGGNLTVNGTLSACATTP